MSKIGPKPRPKTPFQNSVASVQEVAGETAALKTQCPRCGAGTGQKGQAMQLLRICKWLIRAEDEAE
jgi:hypothetical protein